MKSKKQNHEIFFYTKNLFQIFLWAFEIVVIPTILVIVSIKVVPPSTQATFFDYLERYFAFYAFYQILVFVILKSINDCKKDQINAIISVYECLLLYLETKDPQIKEFIKQVSVKQLEIDTMNNAETRQEYKYIIDTIDTENCEIAAPHVRFKLITLRHSFESLSLEWNYSFIVRAFK